MEIKVSEDETSCSAGSRLKVKEFVVVVVEKRLKPARIKLFSGQKFIKTY